MADILVAATTNTALVEGLHPGREYTAQVSVEGWRDPSGNLISNPWSASLTFQTITDNVAPATPSNFQVELVGETYVITWDKPTLNADGSPLENDFDFYILDFYPPGQPELTQTYYLLYEETKFELPLPLNRLLFGVPRGSLTFSIRSLDLSGNESVPVAETAGGTPPTAPVLSLAGGSSVTTIGLTWPNDSGVNYYIINRSTQSNMSSPVVVGSLSSADTSALPPGEEVDLTFYDLPTPGTYYYTVTAYNSFGQSATSSPPLLATAENPTTGDSEITEVAPAIPQADLIGGEHSFEIKGYSVANMDPVPRFMDIQAARPSLSDPLVPGTFEDVGRVVVSDKTVSGSFVWVVDSEQHVFVRARGASLVEATTPPAFSAFTRSNTPVEQGGLEYIADFAVTNAKIQNLDASKLMANTAFTNNLDVQSVFTLQTGGVMRSSLYTPGVEGWYLDSTGFAELNDLVLRGNIEATSGYISNVNVRNTLTVGDGAVAGSIQSSNYNQATNPPTGWMISSDGTTYFNNGNFRGYIYATSGYLSNLTVGGQLTMTTGAGSIIHSAGGYNLYADGSARFNGAVNIQGNLTIGGQADINGTTNLYSSLYLRSGGSIQVGTGTARSTLMPTGEMNFYYDSLRWSISATSQGQILMQAHNWNYGVAFRVANYHDNAFRFQVGSTTVAGLHMEGSSQASLRTGSSGITMGSALLITSGSGLEWYAFGSGTFRPRANFGANIGSSTIAFNYVYARYLRYSVSSLQYSDIRMKNSVTPSDLGLSFISSLKPVRFKINSEERSFFHHGLIAQDVKESMDAAGISEYDFAGYNDPKLTGEENQEFLSLDYTQFIAPLINSVQELASRLERLEARLDNAA